MSRKIKKQLQDIPFSEQDYVYLMNKVKYKENITKLIRYYLPATKVPDNELEALALMRQIIESYKFDYFAETGKTDLTDYQVVDQILINFWINIT